jgi:hypothetical protein
MAVIRCENCGQVLITRQKACLNCESETKKKITETNKRIYINIFMVVMVATTLVIFMVSLFPESMPIFIQKRLLISKISRYEEELESYGVKIRSGEGEAHLRKFAEIASSPESLALEIMEHKNKQKALREKIENAKAGLAAAKRKLRKLEGNK